MSQPVDLAALRAVLEKMTEGQWKCHQNLRYIIQLPTSEYISCPLAVDAKGICALRNAASALLTELEQLRAIVLKLEREQAELTHLREQLQQMNQGKDNLNE